MIFQEVLLRYMILSWNHFFQCLVNVDECTAVLITSFVDISLSKAIYATGIEAKR